MLNSSKPSVPWTLIILFGLIIFTESNQRTEKEDTSISMAFSVLIAWTPYATYSAWIFNKVAAFSPLWQQPSLPFLQRAQLFIILPFTVCVDEQTAWYIWNVSFVINCLNPLLCTLHAYVSILFTIFQFHNCMLSTVGMVEDDSSFSACPTICLCILWVEGITSHKAL